MLWAGVITGITVYSHRANSKGCQNSQEKKRHQLSDSRHDACTLPSYQRSCRISLLSRAITRVRPVFGLNRARLGVWEELPEGLRTTVGSRVAMQRLNFSAGHPAQRVVQADRGGRLRDTVTLGSFRSQRRNGRPHTPSPVGWGYRWIFVSVPFNR